MRILMMNGQHNLSWSSRNNKSQLTLLRPDLTHQTEDTWVRAWGYFRKFANMSMNVP